MIGTLLLNRYEVEERIGAGGMGIVYRANDLKQDRHVAAKIMAVSGSEALEHRLRREYRTLQQVHHPNVVEVFGWGIQADRFFYVMEFVQGTTLDAFEASPDPTKGSACKEGVDRFLLVVATMLDALHAVHQAGIIHRDIKPKNVMVNNRGVVKLMDFGLAQGGDGSLTSSNSGSVLGTVGYMAPEQVRGHRVDPRSDLYSVGVLLYEFLAGRRPFVGDNVVAILTSILNERPEPIRFLCGWVSPTLEDVVMRLLRKSPEDRFESAAALAQALRQAIMAGSWVDPAIQTEGIASLILPRRSGRLVDRKQILDKLRAAADRAIRGRGHLALVFGEAGVGKSRLAKELPARLRAGDVACLRGVAYENEGVYYQPYLEALAEYRRLAGIDSSPKARVNLEAAIRESFQSLDPDLALETEPASATTLESRSQQMQLFDLVARFLARIARISPLLLILEDLQWADEPSLELTRFLARNLKAERVLLVLTYRTEQHGDTSRMSNLSRFLTAVSRESLADIEIKVPRLDREATGQMAANLLGKELLPDPLVDAIYHHSEGNPYFISEIAKAVNDADEAPSASSSSRILRIPLPKSASDVVERRLAGIAPKTRKTLVQAALIGREFPFDLLAALTNLDEDELLDILDSLLKRGIIEEVPGRDLDTYRFSQAIIRSVLEREVNRRKARRVHAAIVTAMEDLYHDRFEDRLDEVVEEIARHAFLARGFNKALVYALAAGRKASGSHAPQTAIQHLEMAYDIASEAPELLSPEQTAALALHLGEAYERTGRLAQAREVYEEVLALLSDGDHPLQSADLALALTGVLQQVGHFTSALSMLDHGLTIVPNDPDRRRLFLGRRADILGLRGDSGAALQIYLELLAEAEQAGTKGQIVSSMQRIAGVFSQRGEPREAAKYLERAIELARAGKDRARLASLLSDQGQVFHDLFDSDAEVACLNECLEVCRELRDQPGMVGPLGRLGRAHVRMGEISRGVSLIEESLRQARRYGIASEEALRLRDLATVMIYQGHPAEAVRRLVKAVEIAKRVSHAKALFSARADLALARSELLEHVRARDEAQEARKLAEETRNVFWLLRAESVRAEVIFRAAAGNEGSIEDAISALSEAERIASGVAALLPPAHFAHLDLLRARRDEQAGDAEQARRHALSALARLEEVKLPFHRAQILRYLGELAEWRGEVEKARDRLDQSQFIYEEFGNRAAVVAISKAIEQLLPESER